MRDDTKTEIADDRIPAIGRSSFMAHATAHISASSIAHKYRFRLKWFGLGFFPVSWEGWLASLLLLALILLSAFVNGVFETDMTAREGCAFLLDALIIAGVTTLFFEKKMKEPLQWRWGWPKKKE